MSEAVVRVVDVYPYRLHHGNTEFLLLRRSPRVDYAGQWRMIGGKIEPDETAWQTALREVLEETHLHPVRLWTIPSANMFYEWEHDRLNVIPTFAAEMNGEPETNHEHDDHRWLKADEAVEAVQWPEQKRLITLAANLLRDGIPSELIIRTEESYSW